MALHQKRSAYKAQLDNAESIGAGQTIVPALIRSIKEGVSSKGKKYYRISAICLAKNDTFIKMRPPKKEDNKKQKTNEVAEPTATVEAADTSVETADTTGELPKGTTIKPGEQFMSTSYDRAASELEQGNVVKLAITTDWYIDHFTYQTSKVIIDEKYTDVLTRKVYDTCIVGTSLAEIPTKDNFSPDDYPDDTEEKYVTRSFVVPLSMGVGTEHFTNVEIQLDPKDKARFMTRIKDDPTQYIGINSDVGGDSPVNMLTAVFTLNNDENTKIVFSLAYKPEAWKCFGIMNISDWQAVGGRFIFYAVDWLAYGYSQHSKIMAIKANIEGAEDMFEDESDEERENFQYSTGFVAKMAVNMKETVKACGIPLSFDYINKYYGPESGYENDHEYSNHPFNSCGWKTALKRNKPFFVTFTDWSADQIGTFIKEYMKVEPEKNNIKFYGVYSVDSDVPYEIQAESNEERERQLVEQGFKPTMIFAINE